MFSSLEIELSNLPVIMLRIFVAFLAGGFIGWERERYSELPLSHRGSMFRLYALVCFGSCMFTVAGVFGFSSTAYIADRIPAQIVSGVGFLGAGTILKDKSGFLRGLPTAAGIWVSASIGLMIGAGNYLSGITGAALAYLIMDLPHRFPVLFKRVSQ